MQLLAPALILAAAVLLAVAVQGTKTPSTQLDLCKAWCQMCCNLVAALLQSAQQAQIALQLKTSIERKTQH
jgi:hypothetical protein